MGTYFLEQLGNIHNPMIKEIRGRGLMIGLEFLPEAGGARQYSERLKEKGLLCKETHDNIIRFAPPLIIDKEAVDWAVGRIDEVLAE
jgi:ornithine--oxo-acid transaminase